MPSKSTKPSSRKKSKRSSSKSAYLDQLIVGSSESMKAIPDDAVTLTVTSPPYWNAIDYDKHAADKTQNWKSREYSTGFQSYEEYLDLMASIFREVQRVTKPGGICAVVVGTVLFKARPIPVPYDLVSRLCSHGWDFHQDIIWHKCTAGIKRAGVSIQKPMPGYFYPNIMTEYIMVFRKPGDRLGSDLDPETRKQGSFPINELFVKDIANNVWHIAPVPPGMLDHPCPYPEEIPHRLCQLYSYPDDLVLDPFLGSGQTAKVAKALGRKYVGYDILEEFVSYSKSRLDEPLMVRPKQLIATFDKVDLDSPLSGPGRKSKNGKKVKMRSNQPIKPQDKREESDLFASADSG